MSQPRIRRAGFLPGWQRISTYLILAVCAISGVLFFLMHELRMSIPGAGKHDVLVAHGISAAFALLVFGAVLPGHLRAAWIARRNRLSGIVMIIVMSVLMLSGELLYYGSEEMRDHVVLIHWVVGFAAFAAFLFHVLLGRRTGQPVQPGPR